MDIRNNMLPVLRPAGGQEEIDAVAEVIKSGWWGKGPKVAEFEEKFAAMVGHKYAVAVTSNSHGQDLVMKALGFKEIDVINPTISFIATAMIPLWNNFTTNIVDVKRDTLCIDPEDVERCKKPNSELLVAVDEAGVFADYKSLRKVFGGFILADTAHSCWTPGAGLGGDCAVWSFQALKTMPMGDGGMITTDDKDLANKCREMLWFGVSTTWNRHQSVSGMSRYAWDYQVDILGYKYYMIDIMAAIGLEQMKKLPANLKFRRHIQSRYNNELNSIIQRPFHSETVQYYVARVPKEHRDSFIEYLSDKKIHTSVHFKPLHKYVPLMQNRNYPVADTEWLKLITLPCHNAMVENDIDYVVYWVNKYFADNS